MKSPWWGVCHLVATQWMAAVTPGGMATATSVQASCPTRGCWTLILTLALLQPRNSGHGPLCPQAPGCPSAWCCLLPAPLPLCDLASEDPGRAVTWKEVKESSVNSLMKRSVPRACSSITKAKTTSWVPSRGMSVSVDLASLGVG